MSGGAEELDPADAPLSDQSGRILGPRARRTRERLLEATRQLLDEHPLRDLRVIDIARRVGTSPATFYQYFRDVEDAVLCLADAASAEIPGLLRWLDEPFTGAGGRARARGLVDAFIRHWDLHHAALRVRNLASDEGDERFARVRERAMTPVIAALALRIEEGQRDGRVRAADHPAAAAAAVAAILERLAAYHVELERFGVTREELVDTSASIVLQTLTGSAGE